MTHPLGNWAVIDIETTGADASYDQVIDLGYLQFEGTKLINKTDTLVQYDGKLSQFIKKLTGISDKMLRSAPSWREVEPELLDLYGHHLLAHNSDFEKAFLEQYFDKIEDGTPRESYEDSMFYLGLLFPQFDSLKLERFICDWGLSDQEMHRGYQDSVDLLKVLLIATKITHDDRQLSQMVEALFRKYNLTNYWYYKFFNLSLSDLEEIADQIEFDLHEAVAKAKDLMKEEVFEGELPSERKFSLEFSGQNIKAILKNEELIREKIPHYTHRQTQEDLALKAGQSFKNKVHSLVQAPTGTGKTLGYLLPAALFAMEEKKQVLIATGTKTLQHQAMKKDVPQVRKLLGLDDSELKVRQLIGSNNHLCELLFRQSVDEEDLLSVTKEFDEAFVDLYFDLVFFHNSRATDDKQIVRGGLPYVFKMKSKNFAEREQNIGVDFRSCTGQACPFKNDCSYVKGLRKAKDADIIVGNHALMFSWPKAFPRPEYVVVDEAHKIEGETTSAFSAEISQEQLEQLNKNLTHAQGIGSLYYLLAQQEEEKGSSTALINQIREKVTAAQQMLQDQLIGLPDFVERYFKKMPRFTDLFWNEQLMIRKETSDALGRSIYNHLDSIRHIISNLQNDLLPYSDRWDAKNLKDDNQVIALTRFETFFGHLDDIRVALELGLSYPEPKAEMTRSIKYHEKHGFCVTTAPVNVGKILHDGLLSTSASVLYTSATLGNAHGDQGAKGIEWCTGYSYLETDRRFRSGFYLPATYDYQENTRVFLCDDTLPFYNKEFVPQTLKPIMKLIRDLGGRTLLLFSARSRFEVAREVLLKEFEGEIPLFIQGMGNNIVDEFKKSQEGGILLGMESFGEGIDIPGKTLEFVFIDKVPDLRMDLVIQDRRDFYETNLGNEFSDYYLAHRTRSLHQKLGRLLRTETDRGGVIVVDARIKKWKGRTMQQLNKLMEPYQMQRTGLEEACDGVREFLDV
jgi:ATP-dependent DNA helicase DinG